MGNGIAIVGLHRGGTSAIAGVVHNLGVYMGDDLYQPSEYNPKGYFEDKEIVDLHDRMLGNWLVGETKNAEAVYPEYQKVIRERYDTKDLWAIKDPRLCYLLPYLIRATESNLQVIVVYRDPWYAAHSLVERNRITFGAALHIGLEYLQNMIRNTNGYDPSLRIRYRDLLLSKTAAVNHIASFIGVDTTQEAIDFPDPSLAHWEQEEFKLWKERAHVP